MQTNESLSEDKEHVLKAWAGWLLIGFAVAAAIVLILAYGRFFPQVNDFLHVKLNFREASAWGQLGDFMGGILNPLISACTLAVAVMVWNLQKTELSATQKALKEQAETAEQQRQEQRFFDLLNVYQQTVSSISMVARMSSSAEIPVHYSGKEAIAHFLRSRDAKFLIQFDSKGFRERGFSSEASKLEAIHKPDHSSLLPDWNDEQIRSLFDHYFRVVFRVLFESNHLLGAQSHRYVELFRAQLSRGELLLLGFSLWLDKDGQQMIPLAENYELLKYLQIGHLRTELEKTNPKMFGTAQAT